MPFFLHAYRGGKKRFEDFPNEAPPNIATALHLDNCIRSQDVTMFEPLSQSVKGRGQARSDDDMGKQ